MTNMSVASATAGYGNAIHRNNPPQTTDSFDSLLQQQSKNIAEANPETPEAPNARVPRVINFNEIHYIYRLALEMGIEDAQEKQEFKKTMLNLLDKGLMTFQDLEDAVKVPPPPVEDYIDKMVREETKEEIDAKAEGIESTPIREFLETLWKLKQIAKEGKSSKWANVFDNILNLLA